jgi:3-oxoacyl-(acyl-carrier-protein) synthase
MTVYITNGFIDYSEKKSLVDGFKSPVFVHQINSILNNPLVRRGLIYPPHYIVDNLLDNYDSKYSWPDSTARAFILASGNSSFIGNQSKFPLPNTILASKYLSAPMAITQIYAGKIASRLGFTGRIVTDASACASSLVALHHARMMIEFEGFHEVAILAVENQVCFSTLDFFMSFGAIPTYEQINSGFLPSAFDSINHGFLLGQGAAFVTLASEASINASSINPIAIVEGTSVGSEPDASSLSPRSDGMGYRLVIERVLLDSGFSPSDIDLIKTHGTGTPANNLAENGAIRTVFGNNFLATSYKPMIGHTLGVSGLLELILSIREAKSGRISGILNRSSPDKNFISDDYFGTVRTILSLASGMGNIFSSALCRVI